MENTRIFNFNCFYGNSSVKNCIVNYLTSGRFPNFQIFSGAPGLGKSSLAETTALALTCLNRKKDSSPCGCCEHCKSGLSAILDKGPSQQIRKYNMANLKNTEIKTLISTIFDVDYGTETKVYILEEFHVLDSKTQEAFNEEIDKLPPNVYVFICTSKMKSIIKPLQSRSALPFTLKPLTKNESEQLFNSLVLRMQLPGKVSNTLRNQILDYARGEPRRITLILKSLKDYPSTHYEDLGNLFSSVPYSKLREFLRSYVDMSKFISLAEELVSEYDLHDFLKTFKEFLMEYVFLSTGLSYRETFLSSSLDKSFAVELGYLRCLQLYKLLTPLNDYSSSEDVKFTLLLMGEYLKKQFKNTLEEQGLTVNTPAFEAANQAKAQRSEQLHNSNKVSKSFDLQSVINSYRKGDDS